MMTINRSNVVLVIVVVAALAVASVVAAHGHGAPASALATTAIDNPAAAGLADTTAATSSTSGAASAVDPAKQEPTLDQFTSRDPFIQTTAAPAAGSTANPTSSPTAQPAPVSADVKVVKVTKQGVPISTYNYHNQKVGAALPTSSPVIQITKVAAGGVTFELLGNYTLGGESNLKTFGPLAPSTEPTQVQLDDGSVTLYYDITVMQLHYPEVSSGSSSSKFQLELQFQLDHRIELLRGPQHQGPEHRDDQRRAERDPRGRRHHLRLPQGRRGHLDLVGPGQDRGHQRPGADRDGAARRRAGHPASRAVGEQVADASATDESKATANGRAAQAARPHCLAFRAPCKVAA